MEEERERVQEGSRERDKTMTGVGGDNRRQLAGGFPVVGLVRV
jgi:hypothetical protein